VTTPLRTSFARLCRDTRTMLDITQQELAVAVGISRSHVAGIETGRVNPSLDLVWRIADRMGIDVGIVGRAPVVLGRRGGQDIVHARCSGYVEGRLLGAAWSVDREVELMTDHAHGWIDLLAFEPISKTLVIVEIKTQLDDIGAVERQLGWYERNAVRVAHSRGWHPTRVLSWLLLLASDEVEQAVSMHRQALGRSFPGRAATMLQCIVEPRGGAPGRSLALINPTSRRRDWLVPTRTDGRRSRAPYRDYGDAARRLAP
jgi:transcriptional regulator with XRE-family HTH domain